MSWQLVRTEHNGVVGTFAVVNGPNATALFMRDDQLLLWLRESYFEGITLAQIEAFWMWL